jgi:SAM-dependent methyltransferase
MSTAISGSPGTPAADVHPAPSGTPHQTAGLPDASPVRLGLAPGRHDRARGGGLAGAWWPRTHQAATELHALVACLEFTLGVITRLSLSSTKWDRTPDHVRVGDQDVHLVWLSLRDPHTVIVGYDTEEITLLVIAPEATEESAARAMTMAADPHNSTDPAGILQASAATSPGKAGTACAANPIGSAAHPVSRCGDARRSATAGTGAGSSPTGLEAPPTRARRPAAYARQAPAYDRRTRVFQAFRAAIVDALPLRPGQVVLDVGSGTGLCFGPLLDRVGPQGSIIGIDASPEMMAVARERVAREGWSNIALVQSPVIDAPLPVLADAAVFCAVHDILQSPPALRRVMASLRPRGWVAAGGGKWAAAWMMALNWQVRALHAPYLDSFQGFHRPWSHLARLTQDVQVRELALGTGYVMTGRAPRHNHPLQRS